MYKDFAYDIRKIAKSGDLLDYKFTAEVSAGEEYLRGVKVVKAVPVVNIPDMPKGNIQYLALASETYEKARKVSGGYDIYALHEMWKEFNAKRDEVIKYPDKAFIAFCKKHSEKNPIASR